MITFTPTFEESRMYFESRLRRSLPARDSVIALCPFHPDRTESLSINLAKGVWKCHACNVGGGLLDFERKLTNRPDSECWEAINATIGRPPRVVSINKKKRIVATYPYPDAGGKVVHETVRLEPKSFRQRRPDGNGGWIWSLDGIVPVVFNLPALVRSNVALIVEGEKDALSLQMASADFPNKDGNLVYAATTSPMGAGKWRDEYSEYLKRKKVFVFQDNDEPGRKHAQQVCASVQKFAQAVHLVELPGLAEHGDVSDYLKGHSPAELFEQMCAAPIWTPPDQEPDQEGKAPAGPPMSPGEAAALTSKLLDEIVVWIRNYTIVSREQAEIMAAWVLHTYVMDAVVWTPYLHVTAPERECGKTLLMDVLAALSFNPQAASGTTPAALVRIVDKLRPTLFLDEIDAATNGNKELAETERGILNAGSKRGGVFFKCDGNNHDVRAFNAFGPKCFGGIESLPGTVASRSILIEMRRKLKSEQIERFQDRIVVRLAVPIKAELERWAAGSIDQLKTIEPEPIDKLSDRANDVSEILLAIAELAGSGWLDRLTKALLKVFGAVGGDDSSTGVTLLSDIRAVFDERAVSQLPSKELAIHLCDIEGRPWPEWSHGKGISANHLANQLKKYRIYPQTIRFEGKTPRGYKRTDFEDAWARYCPLPLPQTATSPQPASPLNEAAFSKRNTSPTVADAKSAPDPHEQRSVAAVAVENGESSDSELRI